jgi:hypothetical protein
MHSPLKGFYSQLNGIVRQATRTHFSSIAVWGNAAIDEIRSTYNLCSKAKALCKAFIRAIRQFVVIRVTCGYALKIIGFLKMLSGIRIGFAVAYTDGICANRIRIASFMFRPTPWIDSHLNEMWIAESA